MRTTTGRAHHREPIDAQHLGHSRHVRGYRCHVPSWETTRAAITRAVMRHPPNTELPRGRHQRFRRPAEPRGAVVPEDNEICFCGGRAAVVHVQRPSVAEVEIKLYHHRPSVPARTPTRGRPIPRAGQARAASRRRHDIAYPADYA
jgi:hypothetical protein